VAHAQAVEKHLVAYPELHTSVDRDHDEPWTTELFGPYGRRQKSERGSGSGEGTRPPS